MTRRLVGQPSVELCFIGQAAPMTEARIGGGAVFKNHVVPSKPNGVTSRVQNAIPHRHVVVIKARNTVISDIKAAILYQHVIAGAQIDSVVSAQKRNTPNGNIP